jgi:putative FmdB family regulatory protein
MPIYEYKCRKCGKEFEVFQGIADSPIRACRFCKGSVEKLMSRSSFQLRGSGWYVTDYGGKKAQKIEAKKEEETVSSTPKETVKNETSTKTGSGE